MITKERKIRDIVLIYNELENERLELVRATNSVESRIRQLNSSIELLIGEKKCKEVLNDINKTFNDSIN